MLINDNKIQKEKYFAFFKNKINEYYPIYEKSWLSLKSLMTFEKFSKNEYIVTTGDIAKNIYFICSGAIRSFIVDENGNHYNKSIFLETNFVTSTTSCLLTELSEFTSESLEETTFISMNFNAYKRIINQSDDLKNFYIAYIEKEWIIEKEKREISIVMENSTTRYSKLLLQHPNIDKRIAQHHLASHLGITPTQLSRIKKNLKNSKINICK